MDTEPHAGATTVGSVTDALALALERASASGRWDVVAMLARELEARRSAGTNVVQLPVGSVRRR